MQNFTRNYIDSSDDKSSQIMVEKIRNLESSLLETVNFKINDKMM